MVYDCWWTRVFELKWLFFLDLSIVDRRLHDDLRKIYLHLKAPRFDLHRTKVNSGAWRDSHLTAFPNLICTRMFALFHSQVH
jgi:hypothetical protein